MATYKDSRYNIALPSGAGGAMVLIKTVTASSDSTISFVDGTSDVVLDNTYRTYLFKFIDIHPSNNDVTFRFNGSDDDSSHSYDVTKTTTSFEAYHDEADTSTNLTYSAASDLAQSSGFQDLTGGIGNGNDESGSGELWLFNPSSTTYVKHYISRSNFLYESDYTFQRLNGGYFNTTADITAIQFKMSSGNIDAGTIKLYGIA